MSWSILLDLNSLPIYCYMIWLTINLSEYRNPEYTKLHLPPITSFAYLGFYLELDHPGITDTGRENYPTLPPHSTPLHPSPFASTKSSCNSSTFFLGHFPLKCRRCILSTFKGKSIQGVNSPFVCKWPSLPLLWAQIHYTSAPLAQSLPVCANPLLSTPVYTFPLHSSTLSIHLVYPTPVHTYLSHYCAPISPHPCMHAPIKPTALCTYLKYLSTPPALNGVY